MSRVQKHCCNNLYFLNHFDYSLGHLQKLATSPPIPESFHLSFQSNFPLSQNYLNPFWNLSKKFKPSPLLKKSSPPYVKLVMQQIFTLESKDVLSFFFYFMLNTFLLTYAHLYKSSVAFSFKIFLSKLFIKLANKAF